MTVPSENVKLPHPNVNMTSSGIHTQFKEKYSQPNKNANNVKPANVRSQAKTNAVPPPDMKADMYLKENDERISDKTDNNTINQTSPQKTSHNIARKPIACPKTFSERNWTEGYSYSLFFRSKSILYQTQQRHTPHRN